MFSEDLATEVGRRYGASVEMMQYKNGIFDDASISVIALDTVDEISKLAGTPQTRDGFARMSWCVLCERRRFKRTSGLGGVLTFGDEDNAPAIAVTMRDERCAMVNLDPDSATPAPEVIKAIVRRNENYAGIYGTVICVGRLAVRQQVFLRKAADITKSRISI